MMTLGDVQGKQIEIRKIFHHFELSNGSYDITEKEKIRSQLLQSLNVRLHEYFEAWKHSITSTT